METDFNLLSFIIISFITFILIPALGAFLVSYVIKRHNDREMKALKDDLPQRFNSLLADAHGGHPENVLYTAKPLISEKIPEMAGS